ncbi:hypothetical protein [Streptomyces europaeiscabiei]|uniref:hypothetical protein n=1 Tax=Streptomyces europaeiscabiei TaxID=146819 RepID=UPI0038F6AF17
MHRFVFAPERDAGFRDCGAHGHGRGASTGTRPTGAAWRGSAPQPDGRPSQRSEGAVGDERLCCLDEREEYEEYEE